jgi:hypothetical protein
VDIRGAKMLRLRTYLFLILSLAGGPFLHLASADTVSMKLVTVGAGSAGGPNVAGGVYVYPYYFSVNGSSDLVALLCDDYDDDVYLGETWMANRTPLSAGALAPTSPLTTQAAYKEAAWLFDQLQGVPSSSLAASINFAIWGLFSPDGLTSSGYASTNAAAWRSAADVAINTLPSSYYDKFVLYTPISGTQSTGGLPQEYIGYATVPEPSSLLLLGAGGMGLLQSWRRKRRANSLPQQTC